MSRVNLEANFTDGDAFYAALTDLHRNLEAEASERVNARLILLLANHIGDEAVLQEALAIAGQIKDETKGEIADSSNDLN